MTDITLPNRQDAISDSAVWGSADYLVNNQPSWIQQNVVNSGSVDFNSRGGVLRARNAGDEAGMQGGLGLGNYSNEVFTLRMQCSPRNNWWNGHCNFGFPNSTGENPGGSYADLINGEIVVNGSQVNSFSGLGDNVNYTVEFTNDSAQGRTIFRVWGGDPINSPEFEHIENNDTGALGSIRVNLISNGNNNELYIPWMMERRAAIQL